MIDHDDDQPALVGALKDLLQSPGWHWLCQQAEQDYGPAGYGRRLNAAVAEIPNGPDQPYEIAAATKRIHEECRAVNALIKRPKEELDRLTIKPDTRPFAQFRRTGR